MRIKHIIIAVLVILLGSFVTVFGQQHTENKADQTLRGSGRVNPSTLGMEFDLPLGNYAGRGINVPIGLSYSSKVWRMDSRGRQPKAGPNHMCVNTFKAKFSENSASGWNTTMQEAYIEYSGSDNLFNGEGFPLSDDCPYDPPSTNNNASYIRRIQVHLPSGESHELRLDDEPKIYDRGGCTYQGEPLCTNRPVLPENWTGWYYATDGSNIKYYENRTNNTYYLGLPDGSYYEFSNNMSNFSNGDRRTIRKATKFIDRHGNFNTYHESTTLFPNGYWTDTIGRNLGVPLPRTAPSTSGDQTYTMPGLTGSDPVSYTFYWKKLKDTSASTSALTDFSQDLKFLGAHLSFPHSNSPASHPSALFGSDYDAWVIDTSTTPFNPVLLTAIKLPSGQMYKFSYNIYGEIDKVYYPTGGEEKFEYGKVPALTQQDQPNIPIDDSNRGVVNRKVYENSTAATPYQSTYSATWVAPHGYKLTINNPDGTRSERFLHQGNVNQNEYQGDWGFDNGLAGMAYEERSYSSTGLLTNRSLSRWEVSMLPAVGNIAPWHPRLTNTESIIFDESGNGLSATVKIEYESDLSQKETPLLANKTLQYAFVAMPVPVINPDPDPEPTPVPTPIPPTLLRTTETIYLQFDPNIPQTTKDIYRWKNMVGIATSAVVKDAGGTIVSRSEMSYDDAAYSPVIGRGNPTTSRVWDSTKGTVTNPSSYLETHAKFDWYGNLIESTDAKGIKTYTEYSATYGYAFPTTVTTSVPDPTNLSGSNVAFTTSVSYGPDHRFTIDYN